MHRPTAAGQPPPPLSAAAAAAVAAARPTPPARLALASRTRAGPPSSSGVCREVPPDSSSQPFGIRPHAHVGCGNRTKKHGAASGTDPTQRSAPGRTRGNAEAWRLDRNRRPDATLLHLYPTSSSVEPNFICQGWRWPRRRLGLLSSCNNKKCTVVVADPV